MIRRLLPLSIPALLCLVAACSQPAEPEGCVDDCFTPPAPICNGDVLTSFSPLGACEEDRCVYPPVTTDCAAQGGSCVGSACVLPEDPCEDVTCDAPPEATCEGDTLVTWSETGECNGETGECEYVRTATDCIERNQICSNARCIAAADPCVDVVCEDEPEDTCEGNVAVRFNDAGVCDDGDCVYSESARVDCDATGGVCVRGRCTPRDPCDGVVCDAPPASTCDGNIANGYDALGTCMDGVCRYIDAVENCALSGEVCVDGACEPPDPCIGVRCNLAPAARCDGTEAVTYATVGICDDGFCTYPATRTNCAETGERCVSGACVPSAGPCEGVVCDDPPASTCAGTVLTEYANPGTCSAGDCNYSSAPFDCASIGRVCDAGECVLADPLCDGVFCGPAPDDSCDEDGQILTNYAGTNACVAGECVAPSETIDCTEMGMVCRDGACAPRDTCAGVVCRLPNRCEGGVAVSYTGDGTCSEGICSYAAVETRTNCGTLGLPCFNGACQRQIDTLALGDIMITEIMPAPSSGDPLDAWVELENRTRGELNLRGLLVYGDPDSGEVFEIDEDVFVPPGGFAILTGRLPGPAAGVPTYVWPADFDMLEASDTVRLDVSVEGTIGLVEYVAASWPFDRGVSAQIDASSDDIMASFDVSNWCPSTRLHASGDTASPGRRGDACTQRLGVGSIVLSEMMFDGRGARPEDAYQWFELFNTSGSNLSLAGVTIEVDDGSWYTFPVGTSVFDGSYWAAASRLFAGEHFDAVFDGVSLPNAGGTVRLTMAGIELDSAVLSAPYGGPASRSVGVEGAVTADTNDDISDWCAQAGDPGQPFGAGTPGSSNACAE